MRFVPTENLPFAVSNYPWNVCVLIHLFFSKFFFVNTFIVFLLIFFSSINILPQALSWGNCCRMGLRADRGRQEAAGGGGAQDCALPHAAQCWGGGLWPPHGNGAAGAPHCRRWFIRGTHVFLYYTRTDFMPFATREIRPNYFNVL